MSLYVDLKESAMRAVYLVEDSRDDATLAQRALVKSGLDNPIEWYETAEAALSALDTSEELPLLILLDLAFPGRMNGVTFMEHLRKNKKTHDIPVIVLTHSVNSMPDTYRLKALAYLLKPVRAEKLLETLSQVGLRWQVTE